MLNGLLFDVEWFAHTGIKYLNMEASNLKTVWDAHKSMSSCENK